MHKFVFPSEVSSVWGLRCRLFGIPCSVRQGKIEESRQRAFSSVKCHLISSFVLVYRRHKGDAERLRPVSAKAEWVGTQLQQSESLQSTFQDTSMARGTDVRAERPTSAEWEAAHEVPDKQVPVENQKEEAEYEPLTQAPPTPVSGTPVPGWHARSRHAAAPPLRSSWA